MTSTYTANQGIEKMDTGDQSGTWGGTVNTNMDIIDRAISGVGALTLTGSTTTLTTTDGTLTDGMYRVLVLGDGGDLGSDNTITISPNDQDKAYLVYNNLSANRNAIFTQGTGANATVENGETAWIYADGGGSGAIVRTAVSSTKLLDQDADTGIRVEEGGDDDDTIRFDVAGAEDFTMTANTFNVLSGSTLDVNSGATITNNGTATGFGADAERAFAGVLETNSTFVDQTIFGPAVDGRAWNGFWEKASLFSSLMLATVEDAGADTQVNIWDLTAQTAGAISTSALGTVTLSGDATPTSIAACMGYIIVGSEDGTSIIDPHSGAWAERTVGYPRSLSTSGSPALSNASVNQVAAGFNDTPAFDPITNGPMPTFAVSYGAGTVTSSVIKDDGSVFDSATGGSTTGLAAGVASGYMFQTGQNTLQMRVFKISTTLADYTATNGRNLLRSFDSIGIYNPTAVTAGTFNVKPYGQEFKWAAGTADYVVLGITSDWDDPDSYLGARVSRTYSTGLYGDSTRGIWLSNSATVDRSANSNALTDNGSVTEGAASSGTDVYGYSGFSDSSNYLYRAYDADLDFGTGPFTSIIWFKKTGTSGVQYLWSRKSVASGGSNIFVSTADGAHTLRSFIGDGSNSTDNSALGYTANVWNQLVIVWNGEFGTNKVYINGVLKSTVTNSSVGNLDNSNARLSVGATEDGTAALDQGSVSLFRLIAIELSDSQVRTFYEAEKGMFEDDAKSFLLSGSTNAILDTSIDPLTGKIIVTQTDKINIFDGLVNVSQPTVNSGNSERGDLWGDLRAEINSANCYVTAPATDQRQVNEVVRGLASDLSAGPDLGRAKAWILFTGTGTISIQASYNVKKIVDVATGRYEIHFAIPFKTDKYCALGADGNTTAQGFTQFPTGTQDKKAIQIDCVSHAGAFQDQAFVYAAFFGEIDNE
jgi:hypothetical protein